MLSGFVLACAYERKLKADLTAWRFLELRFIRLYPMFILGAAVGAFYAAGQYLLQKPHALDPQHLLMAIAASLVMLPDFLSQNFLFPLNGPTWTIFVEMLINLAFAFLMVRLRSSILLAISAVCAALYLWAAMRAGTGNLGWGWHSILFGMVRGGYAFPVGVVLGRAFKGARRQSAMALLPMMLLAWVLYVGIPVRSEAIFVAASILLLPAILWLGASLQAPKRLRPLCETMGDISYPFFAVHYPLLHIVFYIFAKMLGFSGHLVIAAFYPAMAVIAWLLLHHVDVPLRRWLSARSKLRQTAMPVTS